jgi:hypothetical protein
VVIWPVKACVREPLDEPPKQRLVPDVHPQRHLRLLAVPAERALSYEEPNEDPTFKVTELRHKRVVQHVPVVSPSRKT